MEIYTRGQPPFQTVQAIDPHLPINRTIRFRLDQKQKTDDEARGIPWQGRHYFEHEFLDVWKIIVRDVLPIPIYEYNDNWPGIGTGCGQLVSAASAQRRNGRFFISATTLDGKNLPPGGGGNFKVHQWVARVEARSVEAASGGAGTGAILAAARIWHGEAVMQRGLGFPVGWGGEARRRRDFFFLMIEEQEKKR